MPRRPIAVVLGPLLLAACALSDPAATGPTADPSLPDVDASTGARPAPGAADEADDTAVADAGVTTPPGTKAPPADAGQTISAPDAAPTGPAKAAQGEILITEVMYDPLGSEPGGEWFEVKSLASGPRSLSGLTIVDAGGRTHVIGANIVLDAGAYGVLVRNRTTAQTLKVPAAAILYDYGTGLSDTAGVLLLNGATGKVSIVDGQTVLAQAPYGGWFTQSGGATVQLKVLETSASTVKTSWCLSATAWALGSDKGTPGAAADCP